MQGADGITIFIFFKFYNILYSVSLTWKPFILNISNYFDEMNINLNE